MAFICITDDPYKRDFYHFILQGHCEGWDIPVDEGFEWKKEGEEIKNINIGYPKNPFWYELGNKPNYLTAKKIYFCRAWQTYTVAGELVKIWGEWKEFSSYIETCTMFTNTFIKKQLNNYFSYHGIQMACNKQPDPGAFDCKETKEKEVWYTINIRLCCQKNGKTYIQEYDPYFVFIREWEISTSLKTVYNFAEDSFGNTYFGWLGSIALYKYNIVGSKMYTAFISEIRSVAMDTAGYVNALSRVQFRKYRVWQGTTWLSLRGLLYLTANREYSSLFFEDDNIFYVCNTDEIKIEKWSWEEQIKIFTAINNPAGPAYSLGVIGNILGGSRTGRLFRMEKSLIGEVIEYRPEACPVTGEIIAIDHIYLGVVEDTFIVAIKMMTEYTGGWYKWFLRRYTSIFIQLGNTIQLEGDFFTVGSRK